MYRNGSHCETISYQSWCLHKRPLLKIASAPNKLSYQRATEVCCWNTRSSRDNRLALRLSASYIQSVSVGSRTLEDCRVDINNPCGHFLNYWCFFHQMRHRFKMHSNSLGIYSHMSRRELITSRVME